MTGHNKLYSVTVTDLGTYQFTVAACSKQEAECIAKQTIYEDTVPASENIKVIAREASAEVLSDPAATAEAKSYIVEARYEVDFEIPVPGNDAQDAVRHAKRLYRETRCPFEFSFEDRTTGWRVREVQS